MQKDSGEPVLPRELDRRSGEAEAVDDKFEEEDSLCEDENLSPLKRKIAHVLESWVVEMLIIFLILADLLIIGIECGIEYNMICFEGSVVPIAPDQLKSLARVHAEENSAEAHEHFTQISAEMDSPSVANAKLAASLAEHGLETLVLDEATGKTQNARSLLQVTSSSERDMGQGRQTLLIEHNKESTSAAETVEHASQGGRTEAAHANSSQHIKKLAGQHAHKANVGHAAHAEAALVCLDKHTGIAHDVAHNCHRLSITILGIFLLENLTKLWINPHHFLSNKLHVLDFTVVTGSFLLDLFLPTIIERFSSKGSNSSKVEMGADVVGALVMLLRLWQVVRVFHGIFETAHKAYRKVTELRVELDEVQARNAELQEKLAKFEGTATGGSEKTARDYW